MEVFFTHLQLNICQYIIIQNRGTFTHSDGQQLLTDDKQQAPAIPKGRQK